MASPRVRSLIIAMYVTEAFGCGAWLSTLFLGISLRILAIAVALTIATAVLHLASVVSDIEDRVNKLRAYLSGASS